MPDASKSLEELSANVRDFIEERDWSQFHSLKDLAISLNLEATEVLELFQWKSDSDVDKSKLSHELVDVLYWLIVIAEKTDIDLHSSFIEKMKLNREKYPVSKSKGSNKKYTELDT